MEEWETRTHKDERVTAKYIVVLQVKLQINACLKTSQLQQKFPWQSVGDIKDHRHVIVAQWDHQVGTDFSHRRLLPATTGTVTVWYTNLIMLCVV